jgi:cell division protein FtsW
MKLFTKIRNFIRDMDKTALFVTIALAVIGTLLIVSASTREAVDNQNQSVYYYLIRQVVILGVCSFIYIFTLFIPIKEYHKPRFKLAVCIAWLLVVVANLYLVSQGDVNRGASNWINLGFGFKIQPGEFSKPVIIIACALFIEAMVKYFRGKQYRHWPLIGILVAIAAIPAGLILLEGDTGTCLIILIVFGIMFIYSPIIRKEKLITTGIVILAGIVVLGGASLLGKQILSEEKVERLTNFYNPCSEEKRNASGYQVCNADIAINLGGLKGVGISKSTQKYSYIPEPHTDMIFAILIEETGFIFGTTVILLYMVLLSKIMLLSSRAMSISSKYMCLGFGTLLFAHILVNLGGLFGILPLTGIPLPFLSYGGSFSVVLTVCLAIVQRIHVETKRYELKF